MASTNSDEIILSYYNCLLRASDVALLQGPHWLNDVLIGFYFEYLDQKHNESEKKDFYFIGPEVTQLLKLSDPSQYSIFLDPSSISNCKCIFFPLNNCDRKDAAGGSHWSLLVYSKEDKTCYHFDSSKGLNSGIASKFARNVTSCILDKNDANRKFVEADCPQQDNGYDCGIYVLCVTDVIIQCVMKTGKLEGCDCKDVKRLVQLKRTQLLNLINELKSKSSSCT